MKKYSSIIDMYEDGKKMGLKDSDIFPYDNPQQLRMGELKRRIDGLPDDRDDTFLGGAWSGD